jgi:hypothetical protein
MKSLKSNFHLNLIFIKIFPGLLIIVSFQLFGQNNRSWVDRSNENAQVLLKVFAGFYPETAGQLGVEGLDEKITDLNPGFVERRIQRTESARNELTSRLENEKNNAVRQDIEILIKSADESLDENALNEKYLIPYPNISKTVYDGIRNLLDDQVVADRRKSALVRLKKYVGKSKDFDPITQLAENYTRAEFKKTGRLGPYKGEVTRDLENSSKFIEEIGQLFEKYEIKGYESDYELLKKQLSDYNRFIEKEMIPRTRENFRLPEELYEFQLKAYGVDMSVNELELRAKVSFKELQNEMQSLATLIAKQRNYASENYRDVIRELKKEQIVGEDILPLYHQRIKDLEEIIIREEIVSLPEREMKIRLASEAESAYLPAPFMRPPRMIGNTGELGEFVLPLKVPGSDGQADLKIDDFTHNAASWPLAVHEGRPGHEMQFASMVEKGVSLARALFAMNSVNVEGWALYMEEEMRPYLPIEGQFATMWSRLVRAGRAFLDPGLNLGNLTREEALRLLKAEIVLSDAMANSEVDRYTFRAPGQATSYFCGYLRLMEMRTEVELLLGPKFNRKNYHDFILSQGSLPPALLRKAIMEEFIPAAKEPKS